MFKDLLKELVLNPIKGSVQEGTVRWILNFLRLYGYKGKVFKNLYVEKGNSETTEIDIVFVSAKGLFVIESKNYSGCVVGDENEYQWTMILQNKQTYQFYNPVWQNRNHIKHLMNYLQEDIPVYSVVVFSERATLQKIDIHSEDTYVINNELLAATISDVFLKNPDTLKSDDYSRICTKLEKVSKVDRQVKKNHIKSVKEKTGKGLCAIGQEHKLTCNTIMGPCEKFMDISKNIYNIANEYFNSGNPIYLPELLVGCKGTDCIDIINIHTENTEEYVVKQIFKSSKWKCEKSEIVYDRWYRCIFPKYIKVYISGNPLALKLSFPETYCRCTDYEPVEGMSTLIIDIPDYRYVNEPSRFIKFISSSKESYFWVSNNKISQNIFND